MPGRDSNLGLSNACKARIPFYFSDSWSVQFDVKVLTTGSCSSCDEFDIVVVVVPRPGIAHTQSGYQPNISGWRKKKGYLSNYGTACKDRFG